MLLRLERNVGNESEAVVEVGLRLINGVFSVPDSLFANLDKEEYTLVGTLNRTTSSIRKIASASLKIGK